MAGEQVANDAGPAAAEPAAGEDRSQVIASAIAFTAALGLFLWTVVPQVARGLSAGDAAYVALAAKSLAFDRGYGVPASSAEFVLFDPSISTGLPFVLPLALSIELFGLRDRAPGLIATLIVLGQLGVLGVLLGRRVGAAPALAAGAMLVLLITAGTYMMRIQGVFMGEPAAVLFVLIAATALAVYRTRAGALLGGLALSLAILTKLIAAWAVLGVAVAWLILEWRDRTSRRDVSRAAWMLAAAAGPLVAFEAVKVWSLGVGGYVANLRETLLVSGLHGAPLPSLFALPVSLAETVLTWYVPPLLLAVVAVALAVLFWRGREATSLRQAVDWQRVAILVGAAAIGHWGYIILRANLFPRYLYIGVVLLFALVALGVILLHHRARLAAIAAVTLAWLVVGTASVPSVELLADRNDEHAERLAVVDALQASPDTPYAADYWASILALVYLRQDEGTWATAADAWRFAGQRIFVVYIVPALDTQVEMTQVAKRTCSAVNPGALRTALLDCGDEFWSVYFPASEPASDIPAEIRERPVQDGGQCNVDHTGGFAVDANVIHVGATDTLALSGWAGDTRATQATSAIWLELESANGSMYAPALAQDRPDIAARFGNPNMTRSGFRGAVRVEGLATGDHRLWLAVVSGGSVVRCDSRLLVRVGTRP